MGDESRFYGPGIRRPAAGLLKPIMPGSGGGGPADKNWMGGENGHFLPAQSFAEKYAVNSPTTCNSEKEDFRNWRKSWFLHGGKALSLPHFLKRESGALCYPRRWTLPPSSSSLFGREAAKAPKSLLAPPPPPQFNFAQFQTGPLPPPAHTTLSVFIHTQRPRILPAPHALCLPVRF